ncbi:MAG: hypothetical protein JW759_09640 [Candidatus Coatesbacteria bacterium]|nr:hypothetical protein [Candidatus Coatesbacteria bacterium]
MVGEERVDEDVERCVEGAAPQAGAESDGEEVGLGSEDDRAELLRRAVFAEESLELSRYVQDKDLLQRLRNVISGQTEVELKQKLSVLKDVLAHMKESSGGDRPTEDGFKEMVASEVQRNLDRLNNAAETVDAAVGQPVDGGGASAKDSAASRLRHLAKARGILIK